MAPDHLPPLPASGEVCHRALSLSLTRKKRLQENWCGFPGKPAGCIPILPYLRGFRLWEDEENNPQE
ncbi:hypothetical protein [Methanogenium sp. MK-MG]|uniref:hypothetical protein n=1 Tax=Methanogenium sp. MK-MG TaxID=2599926 RepID=UPI0013EA90DC|nr:hypothetical protein [Methanogenium sp. MK-MG]